jgi:hypothetical protein
MNPQIQIPLLLALLFFIAGTAFAKDDAPKVVRTSPPNGATDVDPNLSEIVIHFSEPMMENTYSVMRAKGEFPKVTNFYFMDNSTAFVMKVRLKPDTEYRFGINGDEPRYQNFKSRKGVPSKPVEIQFKTRPGEIVRMKIEKSDLHDLGKIDFALFDSNGLKIESADYEGVPLFIVFGAAW